MLATGAVIVVICAGLAARRFLPDPFAEHAGNVLWAVMWFMIVLVVVPHIRLMHVALISFVICATIEFLQLTAIPERAAAAWPLSRWLLGYGFDWRDLLGNATGSCAAFLIARGYARSR